MPQFAQYRVSQLDWYGNRIAQLFPGDDFLKISWGHELNKPSAYVMQLVAETAKKDRFEKHHQILIERSLSTDPTNWLVEFVGFHLSQREWYINSEDLDEHYWSSLGLSAEWIIDQPLLQPLRNEGNPYWLYYDVWAMHGSADDVIKTMVAESMVGPADSDREFANMVVDGLQGAGSWSCFEGRWIRLSDAVINTIGKDGSRGNCDYRVEWKDPGYELRTYVPFYGVDRRRGNSAKNKECIFSFENRNIRNPDILENWASAVTVAYGGGAGGGQERDIYTRVNADALAQSPWARREAWYDLRQSSQPDTIPAILDQYLIDDGIELSLTADILQTDQCLYGRDFGPGDLATVDLPDGRSFDVRVASIAASLNGDSEETIQGKIELWTRGDLS